MLIERTIWLQKDSNNARLSFLGPYYTNMQMKMYHLGRGLLVWKFSILMRETCAVELHQVNSLILKKQFLWRGGGGGFPCSNFWLLLITWQIVSGNRKLVMFVLRLLIGAAAGSVNLSRGWRMYILGAVKVTMLFGVFWSSQCKPLVTLAVDSFIHNCQSNFAMINVWMVCIRICYITARGLISGSLAWRSGKICTC